MLRPGLEGVSLVLVGSFNPAIFQPEWFAKNGLLRKQEAEGAENLLVSEEVTIWTISNINFNVKQDRLQLHGTPDVGLVIRDLAVGAFKLLEHTPVTALGINRSMHFRMDSDEQWHTVGHKLAPKELWSGVVEQPGMRTLLMEGRRAGAKANKFLVKVEPSLRVSPGVFIATTEHYDTDVSNVPSILLSDWETSQQAALELAQLLLERTTAKD